ncbi:hypothetical protein PQ469_05040 [Mucilaginibacter sp. KACC 22773]|uniref:glycine-rich domain-containing protein n=1 Tax=Mucilaginibacter sp. KACC 22773 TaxID=3025671 RepID=UPI0023672749|nr:hypothetical protein [Mucilaginibacter sp. KACC 22773]WDF79368.1 hypothetical protein PQ469_05040 [Mucilaginibacter sp. KACC 22773]
MIPAQEPLWQNIQNFSLDNPGVDFKFSDRLARENGWPPAYALRVIEEYKKFIFLCCITPGGVTPSDPVDQAWHLHLTFTRSYWNDLCRDTLGQQIHHNPTKGGKVEAVKFDGYYTHTHQLYSQTFGAVPPADIWHNNTTRFTDINYRRVNLGRYWLLPKPRSISQVVILLMLIVAVGLFIQASETNIALAIVAGVIGLVIVAVYKGVDDDSDDDSKNKSDGGSSGCGGDADSGHHGGHSGHGGSHGCGGHSGCSSGCSGCSSSGCSGCGGD